jgi:hypothetical protein
MGLKLFWKCSLLTLCVFILTAGTTRSAFNKARGGRCKADIAATKSAVMMFAIDNGKLPDTWTSLVPTYLDQIPKGVDGNHVSYIRLSDSDYVISCGLTQNCKYEFSNKHGEIIEIGNCTVALMEDGRVTRPPLDEGDLALLLNILLISGAGYFIYQTAKAKIPFRYKILSILGIIFITLVIYAAFYPKLHIVE